MFGPRESFRRQRRSGVASLLMAMAKCASQFGCWRPTRRTEGASTHSARGSRACHTNHFGGDSSRRRLTTKASACKNTRRPSSWPKNDMTLPSSRTRLSTRKMRWDTQLSASSMLWRPTCFMGPSRNFSFVLHSAGYCERGEVAHPPGHGIHG